MALGGFQLKSIDSTFKLWYEHASPHQLSDKACKQGGLSGWKIWIVEPQNMLHLQPRTSLNFKFRIIIPEAEDFCPSRHCAAMACQPTVPTVIVCTKISQYNEIRASCSWSSWLSSTSFRHCAMHCSNCIVLKAGSCQKSHSKLGKPSYTGGPLEGGRFSCQKTRWIVVKFETARLAQSHLIAMAMCNALLSTHLISNVGSDQNQQNLREETWNKFTHSGVHWNGRH